MHRGHETRGRSSRPVGMRRPVIGTGTASSDLNRGVVRQRHIARRPGPIVSRNCTSRDHLVSRFRVKQLDCDMTSSISLHPQHQDEHLTGRSYRAGQVRRRRAGREEWTISIHSAIVLDRPFRKRSDDPGTRWQQGDPIEGANRHRARAARRRSWARFPLRAASASHRQRLALAGRSWNGVWRGWPGSLGSPRPRSPMMFRWISSVPP